MDCSPPRSSAHGIFQARVLEGVAIFSSRGSFRRRIKPTSPAPPALAGVFFITEPSGKPLGEDPEEGQWEGRGTEGRGEEGEVEREGDRKSPGLGTWRYCHQNLGQDDPCS